MSRILTAILAGLLMSAVGPLDQPRHVRFQLADGVQVSGELTAWDAEGIDGSFGRRSWAELMPDDAWRLYAAVMDQKSAAQWVDLGRALLAVDGGEAWAERAFRRALRLDASVADEILAARDAALRARQQRASLDRTIEDERLRTDTPEAGAFSGDPWPRLTDAEQQAAIETLQADARQFLRSTGVPAEPVQSARFLVYGEARRLELARLATRLEGVVTHLAGVLGVDTQRNVFWGKAVVFCFTDPDRFRVVEAEAFDQLVPRQAVGICHPIGPKVFLSFRADDRGRVPARELAHEVAHGYLHRFRTPRRLPPWANEGLPDYVAGAVASSPALEAQRSRGLRFIREGGDVDAVLDHRYGAGEQAPNEMTAALGALLVELMVAQRPRAFGPWVDAVKYGKDWDTALAEDYGVPRAALVETFVQYYRVND
jgi:hypothetical protein